MKNFEQLSFYQTPELYDFRAQLSGDWLGHLSESIDSVQMKKLELFLNKELRKKKNIFPSAQNIFSALKATPFSGVKVVLVGQDPYHGFGQAHGLSFSVQDGVKIPPSLRNIYKELETDIKCKIPKNGNLQSWAEQGVLLLNAVLTVEEGLAGSHQGLGWEEFTDHVISALNNQRDHLIFVLWGSYAQKKGAIVDRNRHLVLEGPHPSPLSAHRGFFGTKPFSKINKYLKMNGQVEINWSTINS